VRLRRRRSGADLLNNPEPVETVPGTGPFDFDELGWDGVPEDRLDLGGLLITAPPAGYEVVVQADQETGAIVSLGLMGQTSGLELLALSRGRNDTAWSDRRTELTDQVKELGGSVREEPSTTGIDLVCQVPATGEDGSSGFATIRMIGAEGPRWLLCGTLHGQAATEPSAAADLLGVFADTVVRRGRDPMPPGEPIPLRLPVEGEHGHQPV